MPRVEPNAGLELTTLRSRPELKSRVRCLTNEPPRCPKCIIILMCLFFFNLFMIVTHREREGGRDIGRGRSRLHAPGARCGI